MKRHLCCRQFADTKGESCLPADAIAATAVGGGMIGHARRAGAGRHFEAKDVAACHPDGTFAVLGTNDRARRWRHGAAFARLPPRAPDIAGMIGIGGGGGTSIGHRRYALPLGLPKVRSPRSPPATPRPCRRLHTVTRCPGDRHGGLNRLSRGAAQRRPGYRRHGCPAGPRLRGQARADYVRASPLPCLTAIVERLRGDYDRAGLHATGTGGRSI